ncbi:cytochrome c [Caulobacter ginsengisoli]|uniref:Cytochrome c n=1 Tax=Caulobacter ginsengisoli TaxID=400775 RepID=A0ABU0IWP0_9CAUL|nr:cytochrome c family protein [Caulobacter ginsengisoli]MDQ0466431.1 cytochrome c [Caulobacter ginsengisoli]
MSDLQLNKILGAGLATGLVILGLGQLTGILFESEPPEKPGYAIAVVEDTGGGGEVADTPPDWGTVLPTADIAAGQAISAKCAGCHTFTQGGANGTGPNLFGVVGRKPGSHGGFAYSAPMTDFGAKNPVWDYDRLYLFLKAPGKDVSGTKMTFVGLKKPEERIAMIAYLHSLGSTLPIPAPKPAAAAPAAAAPAAAGTAAGAASATPGTPGAPAATPSATAAPAPVKK